MRGAAVLDIEVYVKPSRQIYYRATELRYAPNDPPKLAPSGHRYFREGEENGLHLTEDEDDMWWEVIRRLIRQFPDPDDSQLQTILSETVMRTGLVATRLERVLDLTEAVPLQRAYGVTPADLRAEKCSMCPEIKDFARKQDPSIQGMLVPGTTSERGATVIVFQEWISRCTQVVTDRAQGQHIPISMIQRSLDLRRFLQLDDPEEDTEEGTEEDLGG